MKKFLFVLLLLFAMTYIARATVDYYNDTPFPGAITTPKGNIEEDFLYHIAASSTFTFTNLGISISTQSLVASGTTYVKGTSGTSNQFTQIIYPRNIVAQADFSTGSSTAIVSCSLLLKGYNTLGDYTEETIAFSTAAGTGNVAWVKIDTMTFSCSRSSNTVGSTVVLQVGTGNKIGIAGDVRDYRDIYKIVENNVDVSTCNAITGCINTTYKTINLDKIVAPTGSIDYIIRHRDNVHYQ